MSILAGLRFCTAWKAGCVPPGAAGQSQADDFLWGMSQQQSWRQHCPVCRVVHSPWDGHSGHQSCSYSILLFYFHQHHEGLGCIFRGSWGLEITVAVKSGPYLFRMGLVLLTGRRWLLYTGVGDNWFKLKQGDRGDQRQAAPQYLPLLLPLGSGDSPALP